MLTVTGLELHNDIRLIRRYTNFVLSKFLSRSVLGKANILVEILDPSTLATKLEQKDLKQSEGWTIYNGFVNGRRKFTVTLSSGMINTRAKKRITKYKNLLKTLGHELIHVKQYLNNEMFDYKDGTVTRYRGEKYVYSQSLEFDEVYWDSPWEIEAYGRQEGLYHMFLNKYKGK
jgi:hypothetical protein